MSADKPKPNPETPMSSTPRSAGRSAIDTADRPLFTRTDVVAVVTTALLNAVLVAVYVVPALHDLSDPARQTLTMTAFAFNAGVVVRWVWRMVKPALRNKVRQFLGLGPLEDSDAPLGSRGESESPVDLPEAGTAPQEQASSVQNE